jgi:hypothetical protein
MNQHFEDHVEDIAQASHEGRTPRDHGPYGLLVGDGDLQFRPVVVADPVPTGEQILATAELRPTREHLLFQVLTNGTIREVRPEELVDLRAPGLEKFLAFHGDRIYRLTLDDRSVDWGGQRITGRVLKILAGVNPSDMDVVLLHPQGQNRVVGDDDRVDLSEPGVERFETVRISIEIFVNTAPHTVHQRVMDYWAIVRLEYPQADPCRELESYTVTYAKGPKQNPSGTLIKGQSVHLKQGMEFDVFLTDRS